MGAIAPRFLGSGRIAAIRAPTLLVWGERDHLMPVRLAPAWCEALPDATLLKLPGGHVPMFDAPEELRDAMVSFFDGTSR